MAFEQRDNSGSLFKNEHREKDTHANAQGSCMINGVEYWVSAWTKETKDGNKWQSLAFKQKEEKPAQQPPKSGNNAKEFGQNGQDEFDSDIPFN